MVAERNALMEHVYPKLKDFCRDKYGLEFQVVDLRWGIREEAQDDHTIIEICLQEIERCKKTSVGPSFVVLMGQKYGYRPFPSKICAEEFEKIANCLTEAGKDVRILTTWFKKDTNVIPAVYCLQPISSFLKYYNSKDNIQLREKDRQTWDSTFHIIQNLLRHGSNLCCRQGCLVHSDIEKYFISVTEYEIQKGMLEVPCAPKTCLCFTRHIRKLDEKATTHSNATAQKYIDVVSNSLDKDAQNLLNVLKDGKIPKVLCDERNSELFEVDWDGEREDGEPNECNDYLSRLCATFYDKMKWLLIRSIMSVDGGLSAHPNVTEILQHMTMCTARSQVFRGREDVLERIKNYLLRAGEHAARQLLQYPLVVYGQSGSGKTSVLAKAAYTLRQWQSSCKPVLVLRFLGTTVRCCSIRLVLGSVCWQIATVYNRDTSRIPGDYPGLVTYFHEILQVATAERPLTIFFDSLDQLAPTHRAFNLAWLPKVLPPHVFMVLSTLPRECDVLETLKALIPQSSNFLQILPLGRQLSYDLIQEWLQQRNRSLTSQQMQIVSSALNRCSLPLYTRLIFEEICRWSSYSPLDQIRLELTVKGVINTLFDRLEKYQGRTFVRHVLSYLTASKNGLSDMELEDVLSLDDTVLNDVFVHWLPPVRRIPPLLWPRLHNDLSCYIIKREANGILVYFWYHRQFISVARERYLSDVGHRLYIHTSLAHYFKGTWGAGGKKAFRYSIQQMNLLHLGRCESEADRKVPPQPLQFDRDPRRPWKARYNLRKLSELPFHLIESRRNSDLKQEVLFNYEWLHSKLSAMNLHDLLSDFRNAIDAGLNDPEVNLLYSALRVGGSFVNQNPDTLAFDLVGRLLPYYDSHMAIRNLLQQCDTQSLKHSALLPIFQCFESPKGMLVYILEDHTQVVYDLLFSKTTNELVSVSKDNTIAFWDLSSGERTRSINVDALNVGPNTKLFQTADGKYLVCDSDALNSPVYVFDFKTGQRLHSCGKRLATQKRAFVVGNLLVRQKNIIDIRVGKVVRTLDDFVKSKRYVTCGITPNESYILIGEETVTTVFDFESGFILSQIPSTNPPSYFCITQDSKRAYIGYSEDCLFKVVDIDSCNTTFGKVIRVFNYKGAFPYYKFLEGPRFGKELAEISISPQAQDLVLLNIKRCHLMIFNVLTGTAKLIDVKAIGATNKTYLFSSAFSVDGRQVLCGHDHFIHLWSADTGRLVSTINLHSTHRFPLAVSPNSSLLATGSVIHTAIKVWDIDKIQTQEGQVLKSYENPVDMLACVPCQRLVFVKKYYGLTSGRGYKYLDSFGIDVWNLSTGKCETYLPFERYGQLQQMQASEDGMHLGLLLNTRGEGYVLVINLRSHKISALLTHSGCTAFCCSHNWKYIVTTCSDVDKAPDMILWDVESGCIVVEMPSGVNPVFTFDSSFLLYCDSEEHVIIAYSLRSMAPMARLMCHADALHVLPAHYDIVLASKCNAQGSSCTVFIWDFPAHELQATISNVAPGGIMDISKDGLFAVDAFLRVYNLQTGEMQVDLCLHERKECQFARFTHDGKFVIWLTDLSVNVTTVRDTKIVASTSTHEKPTALALMDFGYVVIIGREDGHLLTMKLLIDHSTSANVHMQMAPQTAVERTRLIFSKQLCTNDSVVRLDPLYKQQPQCLKDNELPKAGEEIKSMLIKKATVPHAIIKTTSHPNLKTLEGFRAMELQEQRRGSSPFSSRDPLQPAPTAQGPSPQDSPVVRCKEHRDRRRGSSPIAYLFSRSNDSTPNGSPIVKTKAKVHRMRSKSTQDLFSSGSLSKGRSKSLQDLFRISSPATLSTKPPVKPHRKSDGQHGCKKSQTAQLPSFLRNPMAKAIHSTGSMLVALMDVGAGGSSSTLPRRNVIRQNSGNPFLKGESRTTSM